MVYFNLSTASKHKNVLKEVVKGQSEWTESNVDCKLYILSSIREGNFFYPVIP